MAYNLQSLITILERILNPEQEHWILDHTQPQLQSLLQKATSLQKILDKSSLPKIGSLEIQIREAAHKAEDIIESHWVDEMLSIQGGMNHALITLDLQQVTRQLDSIMEQAVKLTEVEGKKTIPSGTSSSTTPHGASFSSIVVGVDEDLEQLKDRLTGMPSKLEIVPIVGMGGIGKTTIARKLYEDPSIISRFQYARAWATVSEDYDMKAILTSLLHCVIGKEEFDDKHSRKRSDELRDILYQSLYGRRYMIVLDDIWNIKFWDEIRMFLPNNDNGSRILITSRESGVAKHVLDINNSRRLQHQVQLLSQPQSWNLLRQIVFGEEDDCPGELQGIGEKIASDCGGLPLAINVIGGVLSKVERSVDGWEKIAKDVSVAIFGEAQEQFSNILSLSYNHLPNRLKSCFQYMAVFPEDHEIKAFNLIRMWVAEGFLRSSGNTSPEEEAEICVKALVERNLVTVRRRTKRNGKPSRYAMHDLLRDVCIRKAGEEKFLQILNKSSSAHIASSSNVRRVSVQASEVLQGNEYALAELMPLARSFLSTHANKLYQFQISFPVFFSLRLLRVLDVIKIKFSAFPEEILQLVNLRYLAIQCTELPNGISKLCNLQTLIAELLFGGNSPSDIWEMSELRHIWLKTTVLCADDDYAQRFVQKKLLTIFLVRVTSSAAERGFFENIPNVTDLGILYDEEWANPDFSGLHKIETFRCLSKSNGGGYCLEGLKFPCNIRDLTLSRCAITPRVFTAVRALLNLEALRIRDCEFRSEEGIGRYKWDAAVEGEEFVSLRVLQLRSLRLWKWRAVETNFPRLRHLFIEDIDWLEEIPSAIGEITTLESISIAGCDDSVVESAKQIQEEQAENGNCDLQLHIKY